MANVKECAIHGYFAAGFGTCPECGNKREILSTGDLQAQKVVTVVRGKKTRAKTPNWDTTSRKPRKRKGDGSLHQAPDQAKQPQTVVTLLSPEIKTRVIGIDTILAKLVGAGMDTDSKIISGLMTGQVVQVIGWEKTYLRVIDYLIAEGYEVEKYKYRVVCGSETA